MGSHCVLVSLWVFSDSTVLNACDKTCKKTRKDSCKKYALYEITAHISHNINTNHHGVKVKARKRGSGDGMNTPDLLWTALTHILAHTDCQPRVDRELWSPHSAGASELRKYEFPT